tara:strand:+ start:972 stop:1205 length:234 start_codon:yes stop_codon:yes gene_type:complete
MWRYLKMEGREKDIQALCKEVLGTIPNIQYTHKGDYSQCPFCSVEVRYEEYDMSELKHKPNCGYLIAKDLSTGVNAT